MSKQEMTQSIKRQLVLLNSKIDGKILRGKSYRAEARRHRMLLAELKGLQQRTSWFAPSRSFSFLHMF